MVFGRRGEKREDNNAHIPSYINYGTNMLGTNKGLGIAHYNRHRVIAQNRWLRPLAGRWLFLVAQCESEGGSGGHGEGG
jgi:hypothetical protein